MIDASQIQPADCLPHAPPMLFIHGILYVSEDAVTCQSRIDETFGPFMSADDTIPAHFLMEIAAQSVGVWAGYHRRILGLPPRPGLLLSSRRFASNYPSYPRGALIDTAAQRLVQDGDTASFDCSIFFQSNQVAHVLLTTTETDWLTLRKMHT